MSDPQIRLVGLQAVNLAPGDYSLIASAFKRLPAEVMRADRVQRIIGYKNSGAGADHLQFMGVEVYEVEHIPSGMVAWELNGSHWTITENNCGRFEKNWDEPISWLWSSVLESDSQQWIGEFRARGPGSRGPEDCQDWHVFATVPYSPSRPGLCDGVHIAEYDEAYPARFEQMAQWLRVKLGADLALRIEHYGSTAVPGLAAKPIVDILVEVPSLAAAKERVLPVLSDETWEGWKYEEHLVFFKRCELMGKRTFHVHFAPREHRIWEALAFRDYLRANPETSARYVALKRELARRYQHDRERYTESKTEFIREITARALGGC